MIASELPERPSSKLAADLFHYKGEHYLLTVNFPFQSGECRKVRKRIWIISYNN